MKGLILVTGSEGLVGSRFVEIFPRKNFLHIPRMIEFDITHRSQVKAIVDSYNFSAIINFAAYTNIAEAEKQRGNKDAECWQVNVEGVRNLVEAVDPQKIHYVQISTDMVFVGNEDDPGPYMENHPIEKDPERITWYGYTKAEAERIVKERLGDSASILRINYPVRLENPEKLDFLHKSLEIFDKGKLYPLFNDQQISITHIDEACRALEKMIFEDKRGVFHASSRDVATPLEIVGYLLEKTRDYKGEIDEIRVEEFIKKGNDKRRYPAFAGLSVDLTEEKLGVKFSPWREIIDRLVSEGLGQDK